MIMAVEEKESNTLNQFSKLTNQNEKTRNNAMYDLIMQLRKMQDTQEVLVDEVSLALERLVRGMASSKRDVRSIYYVSLVELLKQIKIVRFEYYLKLSRSAHMNIDSKFENGDAVIAFILSLGAYIRAGCFMKKKELLSCIEVLVGVFEEKDYCSVLCCKFIGHIIEQEGLLKNYDHKIFSPLYKDNLSDYSPNSLYLVLLLEQKFPDEVGAHLSEKYSCSSIISPANFSVIGELLMKTDETLPQIHPLLKLLAESIKPSSMHNFWLSAIDSHCPVKCRKKIGVIFKFATYFLTRIKKEKYIFSFLSTPFVGLIMLNNLKNEPQGCYESLRFLLDALCEKLSEINISDSGMFKLLELLALDPPGSIMFDFKTGTKTLQKLLLLSSCKVVEVFVDNLKLIILGNQTGVTSSVQVKEHAAILLKKLISHPAMTNNVKWKSSQLLFMFTLSTFGILQECEHVPEVPRVLSPSLVNKLRENFYVALDNSTRVIVEMFSVLQNIVSWAKFLIDNPDLAKLNTVSNGIGTSAFERALSTVEKMNIDEKKYGKGHNEELKIGFAIFYHTLALQALMDSSDGVDSSLNDLDICYSKATSSTDDECGISWIDVMIDLILNLLSHKLHLMRNIAVKVFKLMGPHISLSSIENILQIIKVKKDENPLSEEGNESGSDTENSDEDANNTDDETSEDNDDVDPNFKETVKKALGKAAVRSDDEESIDPSDLDEESLKEIDRALAEAFRQRGGNQPKSKRETKVQQEQMYFRIKCCDLIDTYIKSGHMTSDICLIILDNLIDVLSICSLDPKLSSLQCRIKSCIKSVTSHKFEDSRELSSDQILEAWNHIRGCITKSTIPGITKDIIGSCNVILKISLNKGLSSVLMKPYLALIQEYFERSDTVLPFMIIQTALNLPWLGRYKMASNLIKYAFDSNVRPFKKTQALVALKLFFCYNRKTNVEKEKLSKLSMKVIESSDEVFKCSEIKAKSKQKYLQALLLLLCAVNKFEAENFDAQEQQSRWSHITHTYEEFLQQLESIYSSETKKALKSLSILLKTSFKNPELKKESSNSQESLKECKTDPKKKANCINLKAKKEAKYRRLSIASSDIYSDVLQSFDALDYENQELEMDITDTELNVDESLGTINTVQLDDSTVTVNGNSSENIAVSPKNKKRKRKISELEMDSTETTPKSQKKILVQPGSVRSCEKKKVRWSNIHSYRQIKD